MALEGIGNRLATCSDRTCELPRISVIVPCKNEEKFIAQCLESILRNEYPADRLEIIVVDGISTDATASIVADYASRHSIVKVLLNPERITPAGLNLGIQASTGDIICRIDAHACIAPDYLWRCVECLQSGGADNVGGAMRTLPYHPGLSARSIALCMSHKFGTGNSAFRTGTAHPIFTDTVFGGCYRKEVFAQIGLFNENLPRTQDMEFNQRLRKSGGRILLDPAIRCDYFASPSLHSFAKHNFDDGIWSILPLAYSNVVPVRPRHLAPFVFIATMIALAILGFWFRPARLALIIECSAYAAANVACSFQLSRSQKHISLFFTMSFVFAIRHFAYGFGSLCGAGMLLANRSFFGSLLRFASRARSKLMPSRTPAK